MFCVAGIMLFCELCPKAYSKMAQLYNHKRYHRNTTLQCIQCNKIFPNKKLLKHHEVLHEKNQYECSVCGKLFAYRSNLSRHEKMHVINSLTSFEDDITKQGIIKSNSSFDFGK